MGRARRAVIDTRSSASACRAFVVCSAAKLRRNVSGATRGCSLNAPFGRMSSRLPRSQVSRPAADAAGKTRNMAKLRRVELDFESGAEGNELWC